MANNVNNLTAPGLSTPAQVGGNKQVRYTFTNTFAGVQGYPQGSNDGTNFVNLAAVREDTGASFNGVIGNSQCSVLCNVGGWAYTQFVVTAITSGTVTINQNLGASFLLPLGTTPISLNSVGQAISSSTNSALSVGPNGATNPTLNVDASAGSCATGLDIVGAAAGSGAALKVISSGTNENGTIDAKGSGALTLNGTATGAVVIGQTLQPNGAVTAGSSALAVNGQAGSSSAGGSVTVTGGAGNGAFAGGAVAANGGPGGNATSGGTGGAGGAFVVTNGAGGTTATGTGGAGGGVSLTAGTGGAATGAGTGGAGGNVNLVPGTGGATSGGTAGAAGEVRFNGTGLDIATYETSSLATPSATNATFFIATRGYRVRSVSVIWSTAAGGTSTLDVIHDTGTGAPASGTSILTAPVNINGTANTVTSPALTATGSVLVLAAGDRLAVKFNNAIQSTAGLFVQVNLAPM